MKSKRTEKHGFLLEHCARCKPGYYCPDEGIKQPTPCSAGSYQNKTGASECLGCPVGHFCVGLW